MTRGKREASGCGEGVLRVFFKVGQSKGKEPDLETERIPWRWALFQLVRGQ